jgi:hypothetical protein
VTLVYNGSSGHDLVESGQSIARRAASLANCRLYGRFRQVELGIARNLAEQLRQHLSIEQMELVVLGPAANRREHLLRIGRGEHEHHVVGRLFQRLQKRVRGSQRQHVDLVDYVDLPAPWRGKCHSSYEVPYVFNFVVGGRVELVNVERSTPGDVEARVTNTTRLAFEGIHAVQGLGKDPRRRGLAGAART